MPPAGADAEDLTAWSRLGDEAAFSRLVARHAGMVEATCRRLLGSGDAEDAAQAVFVILARRAHEIRSASLVGAWLHSVAVRVSQDVQRSASRRIRREQAALQLSPAHPGESAADEYLPLLDQAIASLSQAQREVVVGHFLEGWTQATLSERLGISETAVHMRLRYAMDKLRAWFSRRGVTATGTGLGACLASRAEAVDPALVASCTRVALRPSAGSVPSLMAGGAGISGNSSVMLAIAALVLGVIGLGVSIWHRPSLPVKAVQTGNMPAPGLASILASPLVVHYQRDHLGEVVADLRHRTTLKIAFPPSLDHSFTITLDGDAVPVSTILDEVSRAGGLRLEWQDDTLALWRTADDAHIAVLAERLGHGEVGVRIGALHDLSRLGDPRIYPLCFRALRDSDPRIALLALRLLHNHPVAMQHSARLPVDHLAAMAKGAWERDIDTICNLLQAAGALAQLAELAQASGQPRLRRLPAIFALGRFGPQAVEPLLAVLGDRSVRYATVGALEQILTVHPVPQVVEPLMALLPGDPTSSTRIISALGRSADERAVAPLAELLADDREDVRWCACVALGNLRVGQAEVALRRALEHRDPRTRQWAADALFRISTPPTAAAAASSLVDPDPQQRRRACALLEDSHDPAVVAPLLVRLGDADATVRLAAVAALGHSRDPRAVGPLLDHWQDPDPRVRAMVTGVLGQMRHPHAVEACLGLLRNGDPPTRREAAEILSRSRDPRAQDALLERLHDSDPRVRLWAIVGQCEGPERADRILPLLSDPDRGIAEAAARALGRIFDLRITDPSTISMLVAEHRAGRIAFAEVIGAPPGLPVRVHAALEAWFAAEAQRPDAARPGDF